MADIYYPEAILFDLDGTLVDTALDFYHVVNQLRVESNRQPLAEDAIRQQVSNGGIALAALTYDVSKDHPDIWSLRQQVLDRYQQIVGSHSRLFDGFQRVLDVLAERSIAWSIVTNKPRIYTDLLLRRLNLSANSVVCPEDVENPKPAPDALWLSAEQLDSNPSYCWYVGDHVRDMEASVAAKMFSIAARFGYIEDGDQVENWPHDAIIDHPLDLVKLLDSVATC